MTADTGNLLQQAQQGDEPARGALLHSELENLSENARRWRFVETAEDHELSLSGVLTQSQWQRLKQLTVQSQWIFARCDVSSPADRPPQHRGSRSWRTARKNRKDGLLRGGSRPRSVTS